MHGLVPAAEGSRVVGIGVCAAPIEQPNYKKPPMVVLITDTQSVIGAEGHDRNAVVDPFEVDDAVVTLACALDHEAAQELSTLLERLADRIERSDMYGSMQDEPRELDAYVPSTMRWTRLKVTMQLIEQDGRVAHAAGLVLDSRVLASLGSEACRVLATQAALKARKVRQTQAMT